jgi:hypothetical protein
MLEYPGESTRGTGGGSGAPAPLLPKTQLKSREKDKNNKKNDGEHSEERVKMKLEEKLNRLTSNLGSCLNILYVLRFVHSVGTFMRATDSLLF